MAKKLNKAVRKRRSFFEPASPVLVKWLAEQNDLGVSLQLIIVDAIRNYGEGDVIQAFLKARETVPGEVPITSSITAAKASPVAQAPVRQVAPVEQTIKLEPSNKEPKETPIVEPKPEPKPEPRVVAPEPEKQAPVEVKAPEPEAQQDEFDEEIKTEETEDRDPLDIMFEDIGSTFGGK